MTWFNAIAGFIEHLLWPAVVLAVIAMFRKPLAVRLKDLLTLETPAVKATFSERVDAVAELTFDSQVAADRTYRIDGAVSREVFGEVFGGSRDVNVHYVATGADGHVVDKDGRHLAAPEDEERLVRAPS